VPKSQPGTFSISKLLRGTPGEALFYVQEQRNKVEEVLMTLCVYYFTNISKVLLEYFKRTTVNCCSEK